MKSLKLFSAKINLVLFLLLANFAITTAQNTVIVDTTYYSNVIKVASVGNSITYGYGIAQRDSLSYPAQLGRLLGNKWEVKNYGVSSRTLLSKGDHPYINEKAYIDAKNLQPDVVLIMLGTNDTKPHNWQYKNEFKTDYKALVESFQLLESHPIVVLLKAVPAFPDRWGISDSTIRLEMNPMVAELANEMNLPLIDLYTPMVNHDKLFPDNIHPNAEGAGIMANIIYKKLTGRAQ